MDVKFEVLDTSEVEQRLALQQAAEAGDPAAQYQYACILAKSESRADKAKAASFCRKAAEQGVVEAQFSYGAVCQNGHGVKVDKKEAARWYRQAAEQGFPHAQWNLGSLYDIGDGVPCNQVEAAKWWRLAQEQAPVICSAPYGDYGKFVGPLSFGVKKHNPAMDTSYAERAVSHDPELPAYQTPVYDMRSEAVVITPAQIIAPHSESLMGK